MKVLSKDSLGAYVDKSVPINRISFAKEFRAPFFPVLRKVLENPLEELVSTRLPTVQEIEGCRDGLLLIFDGRCPKYLDDSIVWRKGKMSVKQILFEAKDSSFRLKNHKSDKGKPVMRRQTWIQQGDGSLRRHEYRLFGRATFLKPEADGSLSRNEGASLQAYPVIVHYFLKAGGQPAAHSRTLRSRKKRGRRGNDLEEEEDEEEDDGDDGDDFEEDGEFDAAAEAPTPPPKRAASPAFGSMSMGLELPPPPGPLEDWFGGSSKRLKSDMSSWIDEEDLLGDDFDPSLFKDSFGLGQSVGEGLTGAVMVAPDTTCSIDTCTPDYAHRSVPVVAVVSGFGGQGRERYEYSATFSDVEVPAQMIGDGVISFTCPMRQPGVVNFWLSRKHHDTHQVQYTKHRTFFFLPSPHGDGRLSLAWNNLRSFPAYWAERFGGYTKELDVSSNMLPDLDFVSGFPLVETLVADNNMVQGDSFPYCPRVKHLSLNRNNIHNLPALVNALAKNFPNLVHLSLLGNEVCPIFASDPSLYESYKQQIHQALPSLKILDSSNL